MEAIRENRLEEDLVFSVDMAQISNNNGFKQCSSNHLEPTRTKEVDKEEALQMEAEALAKLQKDRQVIDNQRGFELSSSTRQKAQVLNKQDYDLMVFPESESHKKAVDIDVESSPKLNLRNYYWMMVLKLEKHLFCQLLLF